MQAIPAAGCILFLRRRGDEAALRAVAEAGCAAWDRKRRVVLQAPEGLALLGPLAPSQALEAARRAAAHPQAAAVGIALHHGPWRVHPEADGAPRVGGDALTTAAILAGLGGPRTLVSAAFRSALAAEDPRRARALQPATELAGPAGEGLFRDDPAQARQQGQRRTLLAAGGIAALLAAGWAGRVARQAYEAAHRPATILFDIRPVGEVFVDGMPKGSSPPLVRLEVPPGPHLIEVRGSRGTALRLQVELEPGQELPVRRVFAPTPAPRRPTAPPRSKARPAAEPGPFERFKFW